MRYPQAQPRTAPPTRVDGSDVTMDQEVPHAGTPMAVPINVRFMRSSVDTDASIRIPMRRTADHRSGKKGSPMDGHNIVSFRRGSWIVSRVVLPCGPGCQSTMSHGSTHGLIRAHTRWHPDLSTCTVVFRSGTNGSLRNSSLGCLCANLFWLSPQTPRCTVGKHPSRACPARESAPHGLSNLL